MEAELRMERRDFFRLAAGGILVFFGMDPRRAAAQPKFVYPEDFNAYLSIAGSGRVTVFSGKIEMGQGALTSQAQMAAEELGVPLSAIEMVLGDTDRCPADMGTFGSLTTRMFGPALRAAAARARATLLQLAATRLDVPVAQLEVREGVILVTADPGRRVSYGELAQGARIAHGVDGPPMLREAKDFRVMGKPVARLDGHAKVTGAAHYAADIRVPGMLYARLLRPPVHGATLLDVDTTAAAALPGVLIVNQGGLVAALHADPEQAEGALASMQAHWSAVPPAGARPARDAQSIFDRLGEDAADAHELMVRGDVAGARARAAHTIESTFQKGYVAHAPMEPHAALAQVVDGRVTVWASTQTPFPTRERVARALGLDSSRVRVITPYLGGGFGGKSADAQAVEAARLAQITQRPVQVAWTRAEEFFFDTYDPAGVVKVEGGVGADGRITHWDYLVTASGERGAVPVYDIADLRLRASGGVSYGGPVPAGSPHPFAVGPWRGPGANMNIFAIESQVDRLAAVARIDPLEFRLRNLAEDRMRRVLRAAAERFGWTPAAAPSRRGVGIACSLDAGSYVATIAQVAVEATTGAIRVQRIVSATDMGIVVNPDGARMQMEGGITMGLGYTLAEELQFRDGDILDRNFDTYVIPRFSWVPHIETLLLPSDQPAQGAGEPAITTVGGAIANALFDATGVRLLRLPLTRARVRQALALAARPQSEVAALEDAVAAVDHDHLPREVARAG